MLKKRLIHLLLGFSALSTLGGAYLTTQTHTSPIQASAWSGTQTSTEGSYYSAVSESLSGTSLSNELRSLVSSPFSASYDWSRYEAADEAEGASNMVLQIYARTNIAKSAHVSGSLGWNREHSYPQSKMSAPATSDNHIIFADDNKTNGARGNMPFKDLNQSGTRVKDSTGRLTDNYTSGGFFEPNDAAKGEVARATFYANVKYGYSVTGNFDSVETALRWHIEHPVTNREVYRNNIVHTLQKNRNPFIDRPDYACKIYGNTNNTTKNICASTSPGEPTVPVAPTTLTMSRTSATLEVGQTLDLDVTANSGASNEVTWSSNAVTLATVNSAGVVTALNAGTVIITATSTLNSNVKATATITVKDVPVPETLQSIEVVTLPNKVAYVTGDAFNQTGLVIKANYETYATNLTSGFTLSTPNMSLVGEQTITVSYLGKQTTFVIVISERPSSEEPPLSGYASELFISEYLEGSSSNKALEIYNGTGRSLDLSAYSVALYSNGNTSAGNTLDLTGTLAHNETLVIYNSSASGDIKGKGHLVSTVTYFNGNDAIELRKHGQAIDTLGVVGHDPGTAWTKGNKSMADQTLVRTASVTGPTTTFDFDEWESYPADTSVHLGAHVMHAPIIDEPSEPEVPSEEIPSEEVPSTSEDLASHELPDSSEDLPPSSSDVPSSETSGNDGCGASIMGTSIMLSLLVIGAIGINLLRRKKTI